MSVSTEVNKTDPGKFSTPPQSSEWLRGFFVLGTLLSLLGSLAVAWQYHIDTEPRLIGLHFLAVNGGYLLAAAISQRLLRRLRPRSVALAGCFFSIAAMLALQFAAPPVSIGWRLAALFLVGIAAGSLTAPLLYAAEPSFALDAATASNGAGLLFGTGCFLTTSVFGVFYASGLVRFALPVLLLVPVAFVFVFLRSKQLAATLPASLRREDPLRETLKDLRSVATVLFSLLLFFQFGSEWAVAGWLPLFLIHRLGTNPAWAIDGLALFFVSLTIGRLATQLLLPRVSHRKLLIGSVFLSLAGYLSLSFAPNLVSALLAAVGIGLAVAPIVPLTAEQLDDRFSFHPGFYSGTIAIAVAGAMSIPWLLGYIDAYIGMRFVMLLPAFSSLVVLILALLLMFEARLMGSVRKEEIEKHLAASSSSR